MDIRPLGVCVNALASGLKSFFKLLPEALISESVGNQLLIVASKCVSFICDHMIVICDHMILMLSPVIT